MDDYINRKSVYDALCEICNERYVCKHTGQEVCHRVFAQLPAADVRENVHGEWIHYAWSDECSICGYDTGKYEMGSKFCPNCGADMRGKEDE